MHKTPSVLEALTPSHLTYQSACAGVTLPGYLVYLTGKTVALTGRPNLGDIKQVRSLVHINPDSGMWQG